MPSERPRQRFQDIIDNIDNIDRIDNYIAGLDLAGFRQDQKTIDAVERCLSRISEAAVKLGDLAPQLVPEMPWADIRGIGNHLRHGYDAISIDRIWLTLRSDLPALRAACVRVVGTLGG